MATRRRATLALKTAVILTPIRRYGYVKFFRHHLEHWCGKKMVHHKMWKRRCASESGGQCM